MEKWKHRRIHHRKLSKPDDMHWVIRLTDERDINKREISSFHFVRWPCLANKKHDLLPSTEAGSGCLHSNPSYFKDFWVKFVSMYLSYLKTSNSFKRTIALFLTLIFHLLVLLCSNRFWRHICGVFYTILVSGLATTNVIHVKYKSGVRYTTLCLDFV